MDKFELIEKLSEKANVSYEEAKQALEECDWDILDALLLLEKAKANAEEATDEEASDEYTTQKKKEYHWNGKHSRLNVEYSSTPGTFWDKVKALLRKANINQFVVSRKGEELISMPISVMVLLMICFWPFSLMVLFVALFFKTRYAFRGPDVSEKVNAVMDAAQEKAASAVQVVKDHRAESKDKKVE